MPRSQNVERFNMDEDASAYDADVRDTSDPIWEGYADVLAWVAAEAEVSADSVVLELGSGTGNLTERLGRVKEIFCVDCSSEMMRIAREKVGARGEVKWIRTDLLEYFDTPGPQVDVVASNYAIHHLMPAERHTLFDHLAARMRTGARFAVGDLMFESETARREILDEYRRSGRGELADEIEDEFFWDVETDLEALRIRGFDLQARRFSELCWGVSGCRL